MGLVCGNKSKIGVLERHPSHGTIAHFKTVSNVLPKSIFMVVYGVHDADSHHTDKYRSKHLKIKQIKAVHTGVSISPNQTSRWF